MKRITKKRLIVGRSLAATTGIGIAGAVLGGPVGGAIGVIISVLLAITAEPVIDSWKNFIGDIFPNALQLPIRVLAFGVPGAGKSTLRDRLLSFLEPPRERFPTQNFTSRTHAVPTNVESDSKVMVAIADYDGQSPDQILIEGHKEFFGSEASRRVDVVYFLVDLIPAFRDKKTKKPVSGEASIAEYSDGAEAKIGKRVNDCRSYLNEWQLRTVLKKCGSGPGTGTITSVRLLITKLDLIRELCKRGYVSLPNGINPEAFAEGFYSDLAITAEQICREFAIDDFRVLIGNVITGEGIASDWSEIVKRVCQRRSAEDKDK